MKRYSRLLLLMAIVVLCSAVMPAQQSRRKVLAPDPAWSQYGLQANHSSFNQLETTLTHANVSGLTWTWAGDVGAPLASAPVVGQGIVYVAAGGTVFAFQASDGTPLWSHLSCSGIGTVQPALGAKALLVGDGGGDLAAYDPVTGAQLWCRDEGSSITSAPAVEGTTVYVTNGASVIAVDQLTGNQQWRFTPSDSSPVVNTPAVSRQVVYVSGGSSVFALSRPTGRQLWRTDIPANFNLISAPSVAGNTLYVGGSNLNALRASDGSLLWTQTLVGVNVTTPAVADGKVFVNSQDPRFGLWAFDSTSGAFLWRNAFTGESGATVAVANGVVYEITEFGELRMFDSDTGALLGSVADPDGRPLNDFFRSQAAVVDGTVYIPTADYALGSNRVDAFRLP
jgi:outer membrane protein assembly factor BamB